jgi:hypothetical protein
MEASYRLLKNFGTWPRYTWWPGYAFLSMFTNNPTQPNPATDSLNLAL